jgi:hypothetical protein
MRENLILLSLILFLSSNYPLNSYDNNIRGKAISEHYEVKGGHYDYHYKNDKLHKKFNKPEIEPKAGPGDNLIERNNDSLNYKRNIDRKEHFNIDKGNEVKIKFNNQENMHIEYDTDKNEQ